MSNPAEAAVGPAVCVVQAERGTGLGFAFLKPQWVVTARHVVRDQRPGSAVTLVFAVGGPSTGRVAALHPHVDLAVLEVTGDVHGVVPLTPPAGRPAEVQAVLCVASEAVTAADAAPSGRLRLLEVPSFERTRRHRDGREEDLFIFPTPLDGSPRSGGPLLAADGSVIGVVVDSIDLAGRTFIRATAIEAVLSSFGTLAAASSRVGGSGA